MYQYTITSTVGKLYLAADNDALLEVSTSETSFPEVSKLNEQMKSHQILMKTARQLEEYFNGQRKSFELPMNKNGTNFQNQVWKQLEQIPYGKTASYKEVALRIKNPKAVRAVGSANGRNPLMIIVPCHRVIAADGTLGGYSGGLKIKEKLLELEKSATI